MHHKIMLNTTVAAMVAVAMTSVSPLHAAIPGEKCYGVVKAHKNDCGIKNGHSCAGLAAKDNDPHEWILLPKGACSKITGGIVKAVGATDAPAPATTAADAATPAEAKPNPEANKAQ